MKNFNWDRYTEDTSVLVVPMLQVISELPPL